MQAVIWGLLAFVCVLGLCECFVRWNESPFGETLEEMRPKHPDNKWRRL